MTTPRALVAHTRMPAFDRDSGSQDVDNIVQFLLRAGWHVSFLAREDAADADPRHARRLRDLGVATYSGFAGAERILRSNTFDLALIAFWEPAAELLPILRTHSPATRVVVNSMDVHFLRSARLSLSQGGALDQGFGREVVRELNVYSAADAVLAVSDKERDLLADFLGEGRVHTLPLAEQVSRSTVPLPDRRGMHFVGNFRHLPNREAVEFVCREVLPLIDPHLLGEHPLTVLGSWLERVDIDVDRFAEGVRLVGWVPSVQPYAECSRIALVPLLHGAGVKRKVIQAMMAGTPVVTTPVGAEGLELVQGVHALIGSDAGDLAAGITRLLTDDDLWGRLAEAGAEHVDRRHGLAVVERRFGEILDQVMIRPARGDRNQDPCAALGRALRSIGRPDSIVLLATTGPDRVDLGSRPCWPFPRGDDGGPAPEALADGPSAVAHLEAQRSQGAAFFALPKAAFGWRQRYPELFAHLDADHLRVHEDDDLAVWDLRSGADRLLLEPPPVGLTVRVEGTFAGHRAGPPTALVRELGRSSRLTVEQRWRPEGEDAGPPSTDADLVVHVRDDAILPGRFLDRLVALHHALGVDRLQPAHTSGPAGGPPITERQAGTVAREVDVVTPLPVTSVRGRAAAEGPVAITDALTVGLRRPLALAGTAADAVRRVWVASAEGRPVGHARPEPEAAPEISVLIATYGRPDLLRSCLRSFVEQTLPRDRYEVVVVDDGSPGDEIAAVVEEAAPDLQLVSLRIEHSGRSAAKNHAVLLARGPIVLFFDDDDRAAPDYLRRHLDAHRAHLDEGVAILGHTDWAPELQRTHLMHHITAVDRLMFAYERLGEGQELDWRGFWEGRISCKRALLLRHGLHDQRLDYSIDVELGWRLAQAGLRVIYEPSARSVMGRPIDLDGFCERTAAKGRANAAIAALHPGTTIARQLEVEGAAAIWQAGRASEPAFRSRVVQLEDRADDDPSVLPELHRAYRDLLRLHHARGAAGQAASTPAPARPTTVRPLEGHDPEQVYDRTPGGPTPDPLISIAIPVWSRTPELAVMARRTIERIWEVARVPTEVVVVDNGSPYEAPLPARVHRYEQNRGVSVGWNTGIRLSRAPVVVVLNSDCRVEPGWDVALFEAASGGRRIAFPYTDHCDGAGFTRPDQAGTAGWCFMLARALYDEIGPFDEWFSPAFCEDTDYWHRAWELGIDLSPVPAARVVHARRTSSTAGHDVLLQAHRFKYGWKHGVDPLRAPPYYHREVDDFVGTFRAPGPGPGPDPDRPRVFCIGLNKTATTSFHEAMGVLGFESLHWGGPAIRQLVEVSLAGGDPLLSRLDPRFDAFSDVQSLSTSFELLDEQYPGSRFVLTARPVEEWLDSRRRHAEANRRRQAVGEYHGTFVAVDEAGWRAQWEEHMERVRTYFSGRTDFLEVDLTTQPAWDPLCELLGVAPPQVPFPWANRSSAAVSRP